MLYLEGGERGLVEGIDGAILGEIAANLAISQATLDLRPVLGIVNALLQPVVVVSEFILLVAFARNSSPGSRVGDHEREDGEDEEHENEGEHDEQVRPHEGPDPAQ